MTLYVDTSRIGLHGIGRYSREVIERLDLPWTDLGHRLRRPLPLDVVNPRRMTLRSRDVVYAPGFNAGITRARQFLTIHDLIHLEVESEGSRLKTAYYDRIVRPAVLRAGFVFTVSETSRLRIEEWLHAPQVHVVNTGNGVSGVFRQTANPADAVEDYFLYVGNLREHKNVDVMLDAFSLLKEAALVMVTSDVAEAEKAVAARGLAGRISIRTGINDEQLGRLYRQSTAVLVPSLIEGFGLPAAEAVVSGRPVVYWSGCASVAEIVGDRGLAVTSFSDPAEWAGALEAVRNAPPEFVGAPPTFDWADVACRVSQQIGAAT